jgi:hypothetical protein
MVFAIGFMAGNKVHTILLQHTHTIKEINKFRKNTGKCRKKLLYVTYPTPQFIISVFLTTKTIFSISSLYQ